MTVDLALIALIAIISFITACLAMMFQVFQQPNMIAYPWAVLLMRISQKGEIWRHLMRPFGRCRYCNGVWITIYAYKYVFGFNLLILFAMGLNFFFVWVLDHYVIKDIDPNLKVEAIYKVQFGPPTPWQAMMKSYAILGTFYALIYIVLPILI
jgi:hypothetical protein